MDRCGCSDPALRTAVRCTFGGRIEEPVGSNRDADHGEIGIGMGKFVQLVRALHEKAKEEYREVAVPAPVLLR